jgi:invasion protein IalB
MAFALLAAGIGTGAVAQTKAPAAPAPVSSEPGLTTATYGDWTLRCAKTEADKGKPVCEVFQTLQLQNQQAPIAQIAFGRPGGAADPLRLVVILPASVQFPSSVKAAWGEKDNAPLDLAWSRCVPNVCIAENAGVEDAVRRWRSETGPGRLTFKDAGGRDVNLPFSLRGLPQAMDALGRQ